jgi:hypothetical protein
MGFAFLFLSCEEPDDPIVPYSYSIPRSVGKTINSIDIFWDEAPLNNFQYYEIFYREYYVTEPKNYITIMNKKQIYATISGLIPNIEYKISVVTTDKNGNKYASTELSEKTHSDIPSTPITFYYSQQNDSFLRFVWNQYSNSYAVPFSRYELYMDTVNNFTCSDSNRVVILNTLWASSIDFNVSDLVKEQTYYFKLRTYNTLEKYSESVIISFKK